MLISAAYSVSGIRPYFSSQGGGGYFGLRSYGDVPTFRVDFFTQNILDRVQIWVSTECWAKKIF